MGQQISLPKVEGVKDYSGARVTHVIVSAEPLLASPDLDVSIKDFHVFFELPDFAIQPALKLKGVSGNFINHQTTARKEDVFAPTAETLVNINAMFVHKEREFWLNSLMSTIVGGYEAIKIFPLNSDLIPFQSTLEGLADLVAFDPHLPVLPVDPSTDKLKELLRLGWKETVVHQPRIKLLEQPLRVATLRATMDVFRDSDALVQSIHGNVNNQLFTTTSISFHNAEAYKALRNIFNLQLLSKQDSIKLNSFKILELRIILNNENLQEIKEFRVFSPNFVAKGV